ncbi:MAG TPA: (2Fe-2S)-binding protein [Polyangiales bacterium]
MIVCHCYRVSDREIRSCVREGACSVGEVGHACDAGTGCGGCRPEIASIVECESGQGSGYAPLLPILQAS